MVRHKIPTDLKVLSFTIKFLLNDQQNQLIVFIPLIWVLIASGQRAPFAGSRPNGYKDRLQTDNASNANNGIADRFGENTNTAVTGTTEKLPHLALGDRDIVDRLNTFPVDQRPFWLINAQAIEAQKNQGRPSNPTNQNTGDIVNRFGSGSGTISTNKPNYPSVVYPIEMTTDQRQQAQQAFNSQIQQNMNNNQPFKSNPSPSLIVVQKPIVPVAPKQTINNGSMQIPQPVQGRLPTSGYNG